MKKLFEEIRKQNTPNPSLDEMILAEAEKLKAGSKLILSEKGTEQNGMNISINKTENSSAAKIKRNYGAFIAAAAAIAIVGAGAFTVINLGRAEIKPGSEVSAAELNEQPSSVSVPEPEPAPEVREVKEWAMPYIEKYPEMVAYLDMDLGDGDTISYPVVQHSDNNYYVSHTAEGKELDTGAIFANCNFPINKISERPDNIVLFGHTMINYSGDQMFTPLARYNDPDFFLSGHNTFEFSTIYEEQGQQYRIFAAFIYNSDTCEPDYWQYCDFDNPLYDFGDWISYVKGAGICDNTVVCSPNDQYVTLSTTVPDGEDDERMVVVAKKITENDNDTQPDITESSSSEAQTESSSSEAQTENSSSEAQTENSSSEVQTENSTAAVSDPVSLTLNIPLPDGLRGVYTIDVYRDGNVAYTKTIGFADYVFTDHETIDITEKYTKQLVVYIRSEDLGQENYIRYATYNINYENGTCELVGEPNYSELLAVTPAE